MYNNPILQNGRNIFLYIFFFFIITAAYVFILNYSSGITLTSALLEGVIYNLLLFGMGLGFWYPARFISIEETPLYRIVASHFIGAVLASLIWISAGYFIYNTVISYFDLVSVSSGGNIVWKILIGLLFYFLIISFYYMTIYYTGFRQRELRETELKNLVTETELKSLKFQINPHFIFNSLNSMSALTSIDPVKARSMILKLADFLRYTLANNDRQTNKLKEELANIKLYLDIEKIRFEDKFHYEEDIHAVCLEHPVPNMILQPLFENAIKHAVYEAIEPVTLKLSCCRENEFLKITMENNFEESGSVKKGAGIGLQNISRRLSLIYGIPNLMKTETEDNLFRVILFIPALTK